MNTLEFLKETSYQYANEKYNELKKTFLEMSCHKSEFDIEKLTIKKEGNFIAHNYHFLIRQFQLALHELKRYILDKEEKVREIEELKTLQGDKIKKTEDNKYVDIEISRKENDIDDIEMHIANKAYSCEYMEKCRQVLIKLNGDKEPTNEDWQREEPEYIKWILEKELYHDFVNKQLGIRHGVLENINLLEQKPILNKDYQKTIQSKSRIQEIEKKLKENQKIDINEFCLNNKQLT